ncbi:MAG: septum formation protein Maf [Caulobacter sp.]|nr:septum formation protein Maf [Caulobacter sp.]
MSAPPPVILASKSQSRAALLAAAGVPFTIAGAGVDEHAAKLSLLGEGATPREVADALAELKAVKVSRGRPDALVIGADQTLDLGGVLYDKAESVDEARLRLMDFRGRTHKLHAAVVVAQGGQPIWRDLPAASLTMRPFSDDFLDAYLAEHGQEILSSVGCYQLEAGGMQLFSDIKGDYHTILGLPLLGLLDLLRRYGVLAI